MALTRSQAEKVLSRRCGKWMQMSNLESATDGTNGDLNDPIAYSLRQLGLTVADITNVTDDEVGAVTDDNLDQFLDIAELRVLKNIYQNYDAVSLSVNGRSESYSDFGNRLEKAIQAKTEDVTATYGLGLQDLEAGVISTDFQQKSDTLSTQVLDE